MIDNVWVRFTTDMVARVSGPMKFRLVGQAHEHKRGMRLTRCNESDGRAVSAIALNALNAMIHGSRPLCRGITGMIETSQ